MVWEFEKVAGPFEGPASGLAWDGETLLFSVVELGTVNPTSRIIRYDPRSGTMSDYRLYTNRVYGIGFSADGVLYGCQAQSRRIVQFNANGSTSLLNDRLPDGRWHNQPYDLSVDAKGRIWFSDAYSSLPVSGPHLQDPIEHTSVLCLEQGGDRRWRIRRATYDTTAPRGVLVSRDQKTLYVSENSDEQNGTRELRAYPIEDDGTLGLPRVLLTFGEDYRGIHRGVDMLTQDAEGNVVACAGSKQSGAGPMVCVISPEGRVLETHPVPADQPAGCVFGGSDLSTLYVTTAQGELYRARTGQNGWALYPRS
ncbi:MAG: SMP-30/gluconolactonase/LRE family protein [Chloroflexi bacterium]|nr:SMP-30/gluconolactonase/LRE family protein [Chloroflexota bacterium]